MLDKVRVIYKADEYDRDRPVSTAIVMGGRSVGDYGDELIWFSAPDAYASTGAKPWRLQPDALDALIAAQEMLRANDCSLILVDAYRTIKQQAAEYAKKPNLAVPPEKSKHTHGLAIDVRCFDSDVSPLFDTSNPGTWGNINLIIDVLESVGWMQTIPDREVWHFEYQGA